jgi:hypothetical protein
MASVGHQKQRAWRQTQEHGFSRRKFDDSQNRTEHKAHEQVDPGPQQTGEHMKKIQKPEVVADNRGDHDDESQSHVP